MARQRVVVLGGGFGGLTAATEIRARAGDLAEVVLIDREPAFRMGFRKIWTLVGRAGPGEGDRPREALEARGIAFRRGRVRAVDPAGRTVTTDSGTVEWDYLVVALGAEPRPDLVPGFATARGAYNLYDPAGAAAAAEALRRLERGRVVVAILGLPYKCPPAPYEAAMLVDDLLRRDGRRGAVEIVVTTPQPASLPVAGPTGCDAVESNLVLREIAFMPRRRVQRVEDGRVVFADGEEPYDLLLGVPPHRPPAVVRESGLTGDGEWVPVDPRTLRTRFERVYAVGDVTEIAMANGLPLPKAGVFAEAQARVVAGEIAARLAGGAEPEPFDGRGYCFIEVGDGLATILRGEFLAEPAPRVEVEPPAAEHLEAKRRWEEERLRAWFGG